MYKGFLSATSKTCLFPLGIHGFQESHLFHISLKFSMVLMVSKKRWFWEKFFPQAEASSGTKYNTPQLAWIVLGVQWFSMVFNGFPWFSMVLMVSRKRWFWEKAEASGGTKYYLPLARLCPGLTLSLGRIQPFFIIIIIVIIIRW